MEKLESIDSRLDEIDKERNDFKKQIDNFSKEQNEIYGQLNEAKEKGMMSEPEPMIDNQTAIRGKITPTNQMPANYQQNGGVISFSEPYGSTSVKNGTFERKVYEQKRLKAVMA